MKYEFGLLNIYTQEYIRGECIPLALFVSEYQLTSADLTALQAFTSPGGLSLGNMSTWQQQPQQPQQQQQLALSQQPQQQQLSLASLGNLV